MVEGQLEGRGVDGGDVGALPAHLGCQVERGLAELGGEVRMDEHHVHRQSLLERGTGQGTPLSKSAATASATRNRESDRTRQRRAAVPSGPAQIQSRLIPEKKLYSPGPFLALWRRRTKGGV